MFWGRGTMLNLTGSTPVTTALPPEAASAIRAIALVDELGAGIKVDSQGVLAVPAGQVACAPNGTIRSEVVARLVAVTIADDIVHGRATEIAKAVAATAPGSPFAADFAAGDGGLIVPAGILGTFAVAGHWVVVRSFRTARSRAWTMSGVGCRRRATRRRRALTRPDIEYE